MIHRSARPSACHAEPHWKRTSGRRRPLSRRSISRLFCYERCRQPEKAGSLVTYRCGYTQYTSGHKRPRSTSRPQTAPAICVLRVLRGSSFRLCALVPLRVLAVRPPYSGRSTPLSPPHRTRGGGATRCGRPRRTPSLHRCDDVRCGSMRAGTRAPPGHLDSSSVASRRLGVLLLFYDQNNLRYLADTFQGSITTFPTCHSEPHRRAVRGRQGA